jgi:23S rRNA pseudouridine955/2504/2580 synthase
VKHIEVLFENDRCLALNKPAGLAVQGGEGVGVSLDSLLAAERSPRPLLVHRLDRDTSGVILVAKNREAAALFSALFAGRRTTSDTLHRDSQGIQKRYLAICAGSTPAASGIIETDLEIRGISKTARTSYTRLSSGFFSAGTSGSGADFSLVELELGTGRMHQIRRHLASIGNPILGDDKYGDFALNKRLRRERGLKRLLLHSSRLIIPESLCGFPLDVSAPLPEYFDPFN